MESHVNESPPSNPRLSLDNEAAVSRVAIWMTNYASERQLPRAIDSVLGQSFKDFTLYIFDNHSPGKRVAEIIQAYASKDSRITVPEVPTGLAGIPLMDFAWRHLNDRGQDYTITLGGHDAWGSESFLETLVKRMDAELAARGPMSVALLYPDCLQFDEAGGICGRYQDIIQFGQIPRYLLPQVVVSTVNSPQLFGLWNEKVRRKFPLRHYCGGWDHLQVMEAALHGMIMYEPGASLVMQRPPPGDGPDKYGSRHFTPENLARGQQDFIDQLEWCVHCVREATKEMDLASGATFRMMLTASMAVTYMTLRGTNLMQIPGAYEQFTQNPLVLEAMKGAHHTMRFIEQLIKTSKPQTYELE